ncbi:MAG: DUF6165 family protein [Geminicoccaceae bacterium]
MTNLEACHSPGSIACFDPVFLLRSKLMRQTNNGRQRWAMSVAVEISFGELIDKITILEIKAGVADDEASRRNVMHELALLQARRTQSLPETPRLTTLQNELKAINQRLWAIEDRLRVKEGDQQFDQEFIALARDVYLTNDQRSRVKRSVNDEFKSAIVEEKIFTRET